MRARIGDGLLELHERAPQPLDFCGRQRLALETTQRLTFEQVSHEPGEREQQTHQRSLHVVRIELEPGSRRDRGRRARLAHPGARARRLPDPLPGRATRLLHRRRLRGLTRGAGAAPKMRSTAPTSAPSLTYSKSTSASAITSSASTTTPLWSRLSTRSSSDGSGSPAPTRAAARLGPRGGGGRRGRMGNLGGTRIAGGSAGSDEAVSGMWAEDCDLEPEGAQAATPAADDRPERAQVSSSDEELA